MVAPPPWLVLDAQDCHKHVPAPGPHPLAVSLIAGLFWRGSLQVTTNPWGVHPIGGTAVPPVLVVSRRGDFKGEREIEIPLPFDSSLVTFCLHRKSLARGRNHPHPARRRNTPIHKNLLFSIMVNAMEYRLGVLGGMGPASSRASYPSFHPDG